MYTYSCMYAYTLIHTHTTHLSCSKAAPASCWWPRQELLTPVPDSDCPVGLWHPALPVQHPLHQQPAANTFSVTEIKFVKKNKIHRSNITITPFHPDQVKSKFHVTFLVLLWPWHLVNFAETRMNWWNSTKLKPSNKSTEFTVMVTKKIQNLFFAAAKHWSCITAMWSSLFLHLFIINKQANKHSDH